MRISLAKSFLSVVGITMLAVSFSAHAEYVWLEREVNGATSAYIGELDGTRLAPTAIIAPRAYLADGKDLPLTTEAERLVIGSAVKGDVRLVASRVGEKGILNYYQAKNGRSEIKAVNDLELVPTEANGNTFKLVWKGNTVAASQVNVDTSEGWRRVLKPAKDGTVTLVTPFPGRYLLEVTARINGSVTIDGKKYEDVRHTATLTFEVKN
ncbi:hypothetical protein [Herminiimonas aquatilis]|uniref:GH25 family protein n=1 Tax=Herminiimonas aquatilis TaxID=345342 RepID=A0ABW2J5H5_9BURK